MKAVKLALWVLIVLVFVALVVGVYFYKSGRLESLLPMQQPPTSVQVQKVVSGSVVSVQASSLVLRQSSGSDVTLKVNSATVVESVVASGKAGKTLSELVPGAAVAVVVDDKDSSLAKVVSVVPESITLPAQTPDAIPAQVVGVVTSISSGKLVLTDTTDTDVVVIVPSDTTVLTRVKGGEIGKAYADITVGTMLQVTGLTSSDGFKATIIGIIAQQ